VIQSLNKEQQKNPTRKIDLKIIIPIQKYRIGRKFNGTFQGKVAPERLCQEI
jgi:hypothetical protein